MVACIPGLKTHSMNQPMGNTSMTDIQISMESTVNIQLGSTPTLLMPEGNIQRSINAHTPTPAMLAIAILPIKFSF